MFKRGREARGHLEVGIDESTPYLYIRQGGFDGSETETYLNEEEAADVVKWLQEALAEFKEHSFSESK